MWYTEIRIEAQVPKESIWQLWKDVENWNKWDGSVEYAKINGEFITGATGILKPNGGPKTKFKIIEAVENSCFVNTSKLPFCSISFIHQIENIDSGIAVTHRIEMQGLLSVFFSKVMGKNMTKELPVAVAKLIRMAGNGK